MKIQPTWFLFLLLVTVRTSNVQSQADVRTSNAQQQGSLPWSSYLLDGAAVLGGMLFPEVAVALLASSGSVQNCMKNTDCKNTNGITNDFSIIGDVVTSTTGGKERKQIKKQLQNLADEGSKPLEKIKVKNQRSLSTLSFFRDTIEKRYDWNLYADWKISNKQVCNQYGGKCEKVGPSIKTCQNLKDAKGNQQLTIGACTDLNEKSNNLCCYDTSKIKEPNQAPGNSIQCLLAGGTCVNAATNSVFDGFQKVLCRDAEKDGKSLCEGDKVKFFGKCDGHNIKCLIHQIKYLAVEAIKYKKGFSKHSDDACRIVGGLCTISNDNLDTYWASYVQGANERKKKTSSYLLGLGWTEGQHKILMHAPKKPVLVHCQGYIKFPKGKDDKKKFKISSASQKYNVLNSIRECTLFNDLKVLKLPFCGSDEHYKNSGNGDNDFSNLNAPCKCLLRSTNFHYRRHFENKENNGFYVCGDLKFANPYHNVRASKKVRATEKVVTAETNKNIIRKAMRPNWTELCNRYLRFSKRVAKEKTKTTFNWLKNCDKMFFSRRRRLLAYIRGKTWKPTSSTNSNTGDGRGPYVPKASKKHRR
jgi:hypothetical protein